MATFSQNPTRRGMIRSLVAGSTLMPAILTDLLAAESNPLAPRAPHFPGTAKRVIFLYMTGGVSHMDTFDPKQSLADAAKNGKKPPRANTAYLPPAWEWKRYGKSGLEVTSLFQHTAELADELCVVRSMTGDHNDHFQAAMGIHTGSVTVKRPSIGSWVSYGLGTENKNLPSFVVLSPHLPYAGSQVWSADFLPGAHQGTRVTSGAQPVADLDPKLDKNVQRMELDFLARFNRRHMQSRPGDPALAARIQAFETAFGMQSEMPGVFDFSKETDATLKLYGLERGQTDGFGWQCLVARRLAERGVRFVELIDTGSSNNWDVHSGLKNMNRLAANVDRPIAGLLRDLKSRGMLNDTIVVWATEFGRTPWSNPKILGREHHNKVFTCWLAGGGIKGGTVYGASDETAAQIAENQVHVHDFQATILHCLGFDHKKLTFRHAGRDFRLTDLGGEVVKPLLA